MLTYGYDNAGNLTSYTDLYGTVTYTYDAANELTQLIEPGGTCGTGTPAASSGCINFAYDLLGNETSRTFPGGAVVTTTRDSSGRSTRITVKNAAGTTVYDKGYDYRLSGTDTQDVQKATSYLETAVTAGAVTTYGYDSLDRLTTATEAVSGTTTASWAPMATGRSRSSRQVVKTTWRDAHECWRPERRITRFATGDPGPPPDGRSPDGRAGGRWSHRWT